jgi:hypothetical protein
MKADKGDAIMVLDKDQLEALKRQVEEDYRLDMAAIERLQRRFIPGASRPMGSVVTNIETRGAAVPKVSAPDEPQAQTDELTGSLRAMFSSIHK